LSEDGWVAIASLSGFFLALILPAFQVNDLLFSGNLVFSLFAVLWCLTPYLLLWWTDFRGWLWNRWMGEGYREKEITKFAKMSDDKLSDSASKITDGFAMMSGVYAILLAFVVSDKASLAFSSWAFLVWIGWVLSIIIHFASYSSKMIQKGLQGKKKFAEQVYYAKEFFRLSGFMLLVSVVIIPAFSIFPLPTLELIQNASYYWALNLSILSIVLAVLCITGIFWLILNSRLTIAFKGAPLVVDIAFPLVLLMLTDIFLSPLGVTDISISSSSFMIPNSALFLVYVPFVFGWPILLMLVAYHFGRKIEFKQSRRPRTKRTTLPSKGQKEAISSLGLFKILVHRVEKDHLERVIEKVSNPSMRVLSP
jgi:hypothetical protein